MDIVVIAIRVTSFRGKPLLAFADVQIGDLILKDFRVMERMGGGAYVKAPFVTYKNKSGQLRFRQIIDLPSEMRRQIDVAILNAFYRREKENRPNGNPEAAT